VTLPYLRSRFDIVLILRTDGIYILDSLSAARQTENAPVTLPQTTLQHIHLKESRTTSISALGKDIDEYLKQYPDGSDSVVKELDDFLADYRKPLQDYEGSGVYSHQGKIHTFFLTYTGKLSERLITEANRGEDLATVWRNFADESLGKKRLKRVQTLENEFPDWPVSLSSRLGSFFSH
jgi:hypothetical protein